MHAIPALVVVAKIAVMFVRIGEMRAQLVAAYTGENPEDLDGPDLVHRFLKYKHVLDNAQPMLDEARELGMLPAEAT